MTRLAAIVGLWLVPTSPAAADGAMAESAPPADGQLLRSLAAGVESAMQDQEPEALGIQLLDTQDEEPADAGDRRAMDAVDAVDVTTIPAALSRDVDVFMIDVPEETDGLQLED